MAEKKRNIFKGLFIASEESEATTPAATNESTSTAPIVKEVASVGGGIDESIRKSLLQALEKKSGADFDYMKFIKAVDAQAAQIPAEAVRFQSVFATVSVMGITLQKLLDSSDSYLEVLKDEEEKFNVAYEEQEDSVTGQNAAAADIDKQIEDVAKKIKDLTESINDLQTKKTTILNQCSELKVKLEQKKNSFSSTLKIMIKKITDDQSKIKKYLITNQGGANA